MFNRLTHADVMAKDMLFATLDPTMRQIKLPHGTNVILSDTVGFISDLPTELVMAFRATLEEVLEADVIIHVRDYAHPDTEAQKNDVEEVLTDLGLGEEVGKGLIEALNKVDLLTEEEQNCLNTQKMRQENEWPISAITGQGIDDLLARVEAELSKSRTVLDISIPIERGDLLAALYRQGQILSRKDNTKTIYLTVALPPQHLETYMPYQRKKK